MRTRATIQTSRDPNRHSPDDWAILNFAEGATGTVAGLRLNYACRSRAWLVGDPQGNTAAWTIVCCLAGLQSRSGPPANRKTAMVTRNPKRRGINDSSHERPHAGQLT